MTTIRDIAKRANVSIATVSRVLNNHPMVNESTRYIVLKVVQELDYPLENLRNRQQISQSVLVLTREDEQHELRDFERSVWGGVHTVLDTREIRARLQHSRFTPEEANLYAEDAGVSGVILLGGVIPHEFVEQLVIKNVPFVAAGSHLQFPNINAVMADVAAGMRQAVEFLIQHGRRQIGIINGPLTTVTSIEKMDGYRLALALNDLPFHPDGVINSDFSAHEGYQQTLALLERMPTLDALVYADDTIAVGGLRALREQGRRVPQDVAVIGFGDYDITHFTEPPLASVHFDMRHMGIIAARRLMMLLDDPADGAWLVRTPCTLMVRGSALEDAS